MAQFINRELTEDETAVFDKDFLADAEALQTGKIDYSEFRRRSYERQRTAYLPKLLEHRKNGEWSKFVDLALSVFEVMHDAFSFYDEVPDNMKYDFAIESYIHHGDSIPAVRKAVRGALRYGKPKLPPELAMQDEITVYRAGEEPIEKARYRISWTTDRETAVFFLQEYTGRHANHLYRAKIKPEKVIAYTNDREEHEVMQYRGVYDIEEIEVSESNN